ncbi:MAG: transporter, partial [Proteobacteria bacterium]|nr:transporter [Pseudomonadota bacterium]
MFSFLKKEVLVTSAIVFFSISALADSDHNDAGLGLTSEGLKPIRADSHAPIGVMGEHMHKQGEWMLSYRFMHMDMEGNRDGETELSPEQIIANTANRFFGIAGQPANLRIVPTEMTMDMHMFGAMFAPTDWLTLMAMGMYIEKSMDHVTFNGAGTARIGTFTTKSKGIGDTKISGLIKLYEDSMHHIHLNAGLSLPTGSNEKRGDALLPNGTIRNIRLPYPMQLGSGTVDVIPGITYNGFFNRFNWGAQYLGTFRTGSDEGYSLGDKQEVTGWLSYLWQPWLSTSSRISYSHEGQIDGIDPNIVGPVQTADPDNIGGDNVFLHLAINLAGQSGFVRGHRLAVEAG